MNLHAKLSERAAQGKPLRIGLIGAGKFGTMYLAQVPKTPGVHLVGIADLAPSGARSNLERAGWKSERYGAGSLDAALSAALVDPIYAIDKGAAISIVRLEMQLSPYALIGKKNYSKIEELKGKTLMVDGPKGITKIYVERMLAHFQ